MKQEGQDILQKCGMSCLFVLSCRRVPKSRNFPGKSEKSATFTAKTANTAKGYIDKPRPLN